jgi:hypothetical protein
MGFGLEQIGEIALQHLVIPGFGLAGAHDLKGQFVFLAGGFPAAAVYGGKHFPFELDDFVDKLLFHLLPAG